MLAMAGVTVGQAALLAVSAHVVGAWFATVFAYLERSLFRARRRVRAGRWPHPAGSAGADRAVADGGHRGDRVRPQTTRPAPRHAGDPTASRPKCRSTSRPIANRRRCSSRRSMRSRGSTIRTGNASWSSTTRPTRRCGGRSRSIAGCSASASSSSTPRQVEGFKAGALRLALAHTAPDGADHRRDRCRLRGASRLAEGPRAGVRGCRASGWCRRRRITATATAA